METHCDLIGNELKVGDIVATIVPYYHNLTIGKIIKFNLKTATIEYMSTVYRKELTKTPREYHNIVKVG